jgi:hypothetical protein
VIVILEWLALWQGRAASAGVLRRSVRSDDDDRSGSSSSRPNGSLRTEHRSPNEPQPAWRLASEIEQRFGRPVDLRLLYERDELYLVSVR